MAKQSIIKSEANANRVVNLYVKKVKNALGIFTSEHCHYEVKFDDIRSTHSWKIITIKSSLHYFNQVEMETVFEVAAEAKKKYKDVLYCMSATTYDSLYMTMAEPVIEISFPVYPEETAGEK